MIILLVEKVSKEKENPDIIIPDRIIDMFQKHLENYLDEDILHYVKDKIYWGELWSEIQKVVIEELQEEHIKESPTIDI